MKRLDLLEQAHAARAEVLAMIAAWRVSVGAGLDATPPEELRACLAVAEEEVEAADAQVLAGEAAADAQADEADACFTAAGGHYGDA